jgi:hypothetical protein
MPNVSSSLPSSPILSEAALEMCHERQCPNLIEINPTIPYCRLQFLRLCGQKIVEGRCGVPILTEAEQQKNPANGFLNAKATANLGV